MSDRDKKNSAAAIGTRIDFRDCYVLLLKDPAGKTFLRNNVVCIDRSGRQRWNIRDVVRYPCPDYEDAYVALSRVSDHTFPCSLSAVSAL